MCEQCENRITTGSVKDGKVWGNTEYGRVFYRVSMDTTETIKPKEYFSTKTEMIRRCIKCGRPLQSNMGGYCYSCGTEDGRGALSYE